MKIKNINIKLLRGNLEETDINGDIIKISENRLYNIFEKLFYNVFNKHINIRFNIVDGVGVNNYPITINYFDNSNYNEEEEDIINDIIINIIEKSIDRYYLDEHKYNIFNQITKYFSTEYFLYDWSKNNHITKVYTKYHKNYNYLKYYDNQFVVIQKNYNYHPIKKTVWKFDDIYEARIQLMNNSCLMFVDVRGCTDNEIFITDYSKKRIEELKEYYTDKNINNRVTVNYNNEDITLYIEVE